jgi:hypothetical protein
MPKRFHVAANDVDLSSRKAPVAFAVLTAAATSLCGACGSGAFSAAPPGDAAPLPKASPDSAVTPQGSTDAAGPRDTSPTSQAGTPASIGEDGKLGGGLTGYAWVAGGTGTTWIAPGSCSDQGCFKNTGGALCVQGNIAALTCSSPAVCDWDTNWGAMIGWNTTPGANQSWGASAAAAIAVTYAGGAGEYRLMVHVAGDPDSKNYCIERYVSGATTAPSDFLSQCWSQSGDVLPDFGVVDKMGLQLISAQHSIDFDICISAITLF